MTGIVEALYQVKYNPFKYGQYLASFYAELRNVEENFLLAQLVIPICSHHVFQRSLSNAVFGAKKRSSIWSIFDDRAKLYDLQERIDSLKRLTEQSIQYCLVNDWLQINPHLLSVEFAGKEASNLVIQKSAANLAKLLSGLSVLEIYLFFGARPQ